MVSFWRIPSYQSKTNVSEQDWSFPSCVDKLLSPGRRTGRAPSAPAAPPPNQVNVIPAGFTAPPNHTLSSSCFRDLSRPRADAAFLECTPCLGCRSTYCLKENQGAQSPRISVLGRSLEALYLNPSCYDWRNRLLMGHAVHSGIGSRSGFLVEEFSTKTYCSILHHSWYLGDQIYDDLWLMCTAHVLEGTVFALLHSRAQFTSTGPHIRWNLLIIVVITLFY